MTDRRSVCLFVTLLLAVSSADAAPSTSGQTDAAPTLSPAPSIREVVDPFLRRLPAASDQAVQQVRALLTPPPGDPTVAAAAIDEALALLHADLRTAFADLADERSDPALARLTKLAESDDPGLAASARFHRARALVYEDRYEDARPLLERGLAADRLHHLHHDEATFLLGVCQARTLQRTQATATLRHFLQAYPDAPERLRVGARYLLAQLSLLADDSLDDVVDRMEFSHRRLWLEDASKPTQQQQEKIVAILDKLIKEAEKKEQQGGGGGGGGGGQGQGQGPPSGTGNPNAPANQSTLPGGGDAGLGNLHGLDRGSAADQWGSMPDRERQRVLSTLKERFPDRYRDIIEQYYKTLQSGEQP